MVIHLHQCFECATLTEDPPNFYGNAYCKRHKECDRSTKAYWVSTLEDQSCFQHVLRNVA